MNILVTGASGFIGGYIVAQLAKNIENSVIATGRSNTTVFSIYSNVKYVQANLAQYFPKTSCDICIHCAGLADDQSTEEQFECNNVEATRRLLDSLVECKILIYISSSSVYDFADGKIKTETDTIVNPRISLYGLSKLKSEEVVKKSNISSIYILRPRAVYGHGDRILLPRILKLIKRNRVVVPGSLQVQTSMTHIQNLYEAIEKSLLQSAKGIHVFNVADNYVYNLKEVIAKISYQRYGHENFVHVPIGLVHLIGKVQLLLGLKLTVTRQSLNYITQTSLLSIEKTRDELHYAGDCNFFESIHQLELPSYS